MNWKKVKYQIAVWRMPLWLMVVGWPVSIVSALGVIYMATKAETAMEWIGVFVVVLLWWAMTAIWAALAAAS